MKRVYHGCLLVGQLFYHSLYSQFYFSSNNRIEPELLWETGLSAGVMNCLTDIGGNNGAGRKFIKDINWNQTRAGGSVFVNANWHCVLGLRAAATLGSVAGADAVLKNSSGVARSRYLRNLQFRTSIAEWSLAAEIYPLLLFNNVNNAAATIVSPYLIAGVGGFHYTPKAWFNNRWVELRSLHTEGEGFVEYPDRPGYGQISWCLPAGAGLRYDAAGLINFRFEIVYRFTGTDYLDDVSKKYINAAVFSHYLNPAQSVEAARLADRTGELNTGAKNNPGDIRGNPLNKDAWFSFLFSASIVWGRARHK
jgi:hypothetical protein